ncbi:tRNA-specific 2-thiouridylase [Mariniphaga anaerophila]|uniref:tRNA-specific 2-thiouridylase MnmA n=1 Tax=Mariniphaga anaerophila TaxID=1484053 RepID=A0A1M5ELC9_9BACT|nr:tRNA 2-thiouridine(34) synthase MnmA [Mariniphaga anaerophila]SHF80007.1 tRNA-specific 2-thiouridylase [Mariniphaga anaerophila]
MKKRVLLGMSGGIDSSVAAMILQERGFEVMGVTFIFSGDVESNSHHSSQAAKSLADALGISHIVVDLRTEFKELVINYFINDYVSGKTPFPCAVCNPQLKFKFLEKIASDCSCNFIATGHYVRITEKQGIKYISSGRDRDKDQAFFLWGLKKELIEKLVFPLGDLLKQDIRQYAKERGFVSLNEKKESLGICFIEGNNYRNFLIDNGLTGSPGNFIDLQGNVLGRHKGIYYYTIGQRRGLGLQMNKPLFVSEIRVESNEVFLSDFDTMYRNRIFLENTHFVEEKLVRSDKTYSVKIRYRLQENLCTITLLPENRAIVQLKEPLAMVAKGQTAVIYEDDCVLGGGFIEGSE